MATYYLSPLTFIFQYLNDVGVILPGGKINTYLAGTSTPQATYTDITGVTPNANPIILNSAGRLPSVAIWQLRGVAIKATITDSNNNAIGTPIDQITGINDFSGATGGISVLSSVSGTNTITASVIPAISSYQPGSVIELTPAATNTGATTLSISGLSSIAVQNADGSACVGGELVTGIPALLLLNSGATAWIIANPANQVLGIPTTSISGNYTVLATDIGKRIRYTGAGGHTITLPTLATDFIVGIYNAGLGAITITKTSAGVIFWFNGSGSVPTGNRTLAIGGVSTAEFTNPDWDYSGSGIS